MFGKSSKFTLSLLLLSNALASIGTGVAMIAIPWYLVSSADNGAQVFGLLATAVNLALFFVTPFIGPVIDSQSRRRTMVLLRVVAGGILACLLLLNGLGAVPSEIVVLVVYYIAGATFYAFNIPARSAFVQEIFKPQSYLQVNSVLEVENQVAAVLTGVVAVVLIEQVGLQLILGLNILTYALAALCVAAIPYQRLVSAQPGGLAQVGRLFIEGAQIAWSKRLVSLVLVCSTVPYIVVILYTMVHPVALAEYPDATAQSYATLELFFGLGAIAGGIVLLAIKIPARNLYLWTFASVSIFALIAALQVGFQTLWGFILIAALFGTSNAATRIVRQSLLMNSFEHHEAGRVASLLQSWIMGARALVLGVATVLIAQGGASWGVVFALAVAVLPVILLAIVWLCALGRSAITRA